MQDTYTVIEETAAAFIASLGTQGHKNYLAPEFETRYGPLQQEIPATIAFDKLENTTYENYFKDALEKFVAGAEKRLLESVVDARKNKAWLWYQLEFTDAENLLNAPFEKIVMEIVWMLEFAEDGKKVIRCRQYLDTVGCDVFFPDQANAARESYPAVDLQGSKAATAQDTAHDQSTEQSVADFLRGLTISRS